MITNTSVFAAKNVRVTVTMQKGGEVNAQAERLAGSAHLANQPVEPPMTVDLPADPDARDIEGSIRLLHIRYTDDRNIFRYDYSWHVEVTRSNDGRISTYGRTITEADDRIDGPGIRPFKKQARYYDTAGYLRARTFHKESDATMFKTMVEADKIRGDLPNPKLGTMKLRDWADQWISELTHLKPKTRASYGSALRTHVMPALGHIPIGKLQQGDVAGWVKHMAERGVSGSRIRESYKVLRAMLVVADQRNMIRRSPCFGIRLPHQGRREPQFLTAEQVRDIADRIEEPYRTLVYLLAYAGPRWGEACALRRRRVHLDKQRLTVAESLAEVNGEFHWGETKTGRIRTVAIPRFLCALLAAQFDGLPDDPDALIFTAPDGSPLRNNWFHRRIWDPARDAADVPSDLRIHDLRHTCASLLISQGAHPKMIQSHLGHSTIAVTFDVYGHIFDTDRDALADGLDAIYLGRPPEGVSVLVGGRAAS